MFLNLFFVNYSYENCCAVLGKPTSNWGEPKTLQEPEAEK